MKGQIKNGLKATAVLLVAAALGLARDTPAPAPAPNELAGNTVRDNRTPPEQGMPGIINYVEAR